MTNDLLDQLAAYGRYHDDEQQPVDVAAISNGRRQDADGISVLHDELTTQNGEVVEVDIGFDDPTSGRSTDMRNNVIVRTALALAAAVAVIVGFVLVYDDSSDLTSTADSVTRELEGPASAFLDATARRDDARAAELLTGAAAIEFDDSAQFREIFSNTNEQYEIVEPCRVVDAAVGVDNMVECTISYTNDWHGPAGLLPGTQVANFLVTSEGEISSAFDPLSPISADRFFAYNRAFWDWFQLAYPDVYEETKPYDGESLPGWQGDPADMATAVQYVDEFIAQSDVYPLDQ